MRVLVINPNSTESMTEGILQTARAAAAPDVTVEACTNSAGPPAIQGEADGRSAIPGVVRSVAQAAQDGYSAAVIACFDDTGSAEARAAAGIPVIGIGHAACLAALVHGRFSVITTLPVSVPVIEQNISRYGFGPVCAGVHASGLPVLSLESDPQAALPVLEDCARQATAGASPAALVLGCAGMTAFGSAMTRASGLPAIDGVAAAIGLARTVVMAAA
jgi:allantoin racemase